MTVRVQDGGGTVELTVDLSSERALALADNLPDISEFKELCEESDWFSDALRQLAGSKQACRRPPMRAQARSAYAVTYVVKRPTANFGRENEADYVTANACQPSLRRALSRSVSRNAPSSSSRSGPTLPVRDPSKISSVQRSCGFSMRRQRAISGSRPGHYVRRAQRSAALPRWQ